MIFKLCPSCSKKAIISKVIGVCVNCLREGKGEEHYKFPEFHLKSRKLSNIDLVCPPQKTKGIRCGYCAVNCYLDVNDIGWCGLVRNINGKNERIYGLTDEALGFYYLDPLPTNCVAEPVCPGRNEHGYHNLAVFYGACNLDCLYCQNWDYRKITKEKNRVFTVNEIVEETTKNKRVSCICYFGGDPAPQVLHALKIAEKISAEIKDRKIRICWETNGLMNEIFLKKAIQASLDSDGIFKFDFKAWSENIYRAITGVSNAKLKENLKIASNYSQKIKEPSLFIVSILLVPGYVDEFEVEQILSYVKETLSESTPIVFLAFHGDFLMNDLPSTSINHAKKALKIAKDKGFERVFIGNQWLLGHYY